MTGRRGHTKSRFGCKECKRRKVKCDEQRPSCFNCTRHGMACSFAPANDLRVVSSAPSCCIHGLPCAFQSSNNGPERTATSDTARRPVSPSSPDTVFLDHKTVLGHDGVNCCQHINLPISTATDTTFNNDIAQPWIRDLELLHHYCTVTSATFSHQESVRHVWRSVFPREGYMHEFVTHGILSLAALHKAYLLPNKRQTYLACATQHYAIGQREFRAILPHVTDENWKPVYCFALIVIAYVFCLSAGHRDQSITTSVSNISGVFAVTRGIEAALLPYIDRLCQTDLAPLVQSVWLVPVDTPPDRKPSLEHSPLPNDLFHALSHLRLAFRDEVDLKNRADYDKAISGLDLSAMHAAQAGVNIEVGAVMIWPFLTPESVGVDIGRLEPYALVVLSYWAVILAALDGDFWFLRGRGRELLEEIDNRLQAQPRFREYLKWPKANIL
ncbi:hypothetical protein F5B21DRAFT_364454 [Xylaria acuta]|nr:hypothetical protein F5B21DRAFT_364454 [Xylaria acuta]